MYYITLKTSETGQKFMAVYEKMRECYKACVEMSDKYEFSEWRCRYWVVRGGISEVYFNQPFDKKLWKPTKNDGYVPNLRSKEGKAIQADFDNLPVVTYKELNDCIGIDDTFKRPGVDFANPEYVAFNLYKEWFDTWRKPDDCQEVTYSEFQKIINP